MKKKIIDAVGELSCLPYFPAETQARRAIMKLLASMIQTPAQLDWLVGAMINRVGEWKGPVALRGVYCTRFRPADGIEADCPCDVPYFSPNAMESRAIAEHEAIKALPPPEHDLALAVENLAQRKRINAKN